MNTVRHYVDGIGADIAGIACVVTVCARYTALYKLSAADVICHSFAALRSAASISPFCMILICKYSLQTLFRYVSSLEFGTLRHRVLVATQ